MIRAALVAARERSLKVIPICPFFAAYMQRHVEEQDLLDEARPLHGDDWFSIAAAARDWPRERIEDHIAARIFNATPRAFSEIGVVHVRWIE